MNLKENSKANKISLILIGVAIIVSILQFIISAVDVIKYSVGFLIPNIFMLIPVICLIYIAMQLYSKTDNIEKVLTTFSYYLIAYPIALILSTLSRVVLFNEAIFIVQIISTIIEVMLFFLPAMLGINIVKNSGSTQFLKKVSIIEMVFFAIATILIIPRTVYLSSSVNVFGSMSLPLVFFYVALFVLSRDIEETERTFNITDLEEENIAKNVIFTIITFGVYGYIWLYRMSRNIKCLNNDKSSLTGELLCLLFVPFYMLYWVYTRAKAIKTQADCRNIQIGDSATLYLILSLFGLNIISVALMQNDLNVVLKNKEKPIIQNIVENNTQKEITDIEKISQLSELKEKGILTEEEYQKKKQEILERI